MGRSQGRAKKPLSFKSALEIQKRGQKRKEILTGLSAFAIVFVAGMAGFNWPTGPSVSDTKAHAAQAQPLALSQSGGWPQFDLCGTTRRNCIVDGDTFWLDGAKIRIADIDTPEIGQPKCDYEYDLGMKATYRLTELLNLGPFVVSPIGSRDQDQYGRKLRVITRSGQSLGDQLVSEGLARTWTGRREPGC